MNFYIKTFASYTNFDEQAYLKANKDVLEAFNQKKVVSGRAHFENHGHQENRFQISELGPSEFTTFRENQLSRYSSVANKKIDAKINFDPDNLYDYDERLEARFRKLPNDFIVDCTKGRPAYHYVNVLHHCLDLNFTSTITQALPFKDSTLDMLIVLESNISKNKTLFSELLRVLKPRGELIVRS